MSEGLGDLPSESDSRPVALRRSWSGQMPGGQKWSIFAGDARQVLPHLAPDSFQCVVTSPPYFWQRDYGVVGQIGMEPTIAGYVNSLCDTMDAVRVVLHRNGLLFLNMGDTYYSAKGKPQGRDKKHGGRRLKVLRAVDTNGLGVPKKTIIGIPWRVAIEMISRGWILRSPIIWKRNGSVPEPNARDRPWRTHEMIFMFSKSRSYHFSRKKLLSMGKRMCGRSRPALRPGVSIPPFSRLPWCNDASKSVARKAAASWTRLQAAARCCESLWS